MSTNLSEAFGKAAIDAKEAASSIDQPVPAKQSPQEEKGTEGAPAQETSEELLAKEDWDKLKDPEEKLKAVNRAWTQKTQKLAEERRALEEQGKQFESLAELVSQLETGNAEQAIRQLASQYGVNLETGSKKEAEAAADTIVAQLKRDLGPELDFLAERIAPTLEKAVERITQEKIEPIRKQAEQLTVETLQQQIDSNLEAFGKKHPDWKAYEAEMVKLGQRFQPAAGPDGKYPSWEEHMEILYYVASKDAREALATKQAIEKMKRAESNSESKDAGTQDQRVAVAAPKYRNMDEAFSNAHQAAKEGRRYE